MNGPFRLRSSYASFIEKNDLNNGSFTKASQLIKNSSGSRPDSLRYQGDEYLRRLILLIPSEVIALYLIFKEVAASWIGVWSLICLALVFFVRAIGTKQKGKSVQWPSVVVACISFILWIYASGGFLIGMPKFLTVPGTVSVAIGVWTFVIPYFYTGD